MTFNPLDLYETSKRINSYTSLPQEARYRTTINRAYYAAFLYAYQQLLNQGEKFEDDHRVHRDVRERLHDLFPIIASQLEALHNNYRVPSDYYLDESIDSHMVSKADKLTKAIIEALRAKFT